MLIECCRNFANVFRKWKTIRRIAEIVANFLRKFPEINIRNRINYYKVILFIIQFILSIHSLGLPRLPHRPRRRPRARAARLRRGLHGPRAHAPGPPRGARALLGVHVDQGPAQARSRFIELFLLKSFSAQFLPEFDKMLDNQNQNL